MANLNSTDIVDQLIYRIVVSDESYLDRADLALYDHASSLGLDQSDIELTTLPFITKEFLKSYVGWEVCFNNLGISKQHITRDGIELDPYEMKLKYYENRFDQMKKGLTKEILTGDADTPEEYAGGTSQIYRS